MKVESRYCDACGVKIALDDLREGEAVQLEESVFHCKECKAKLGSDKKKTEEKAAGEAESPSAAKKPDDAPPAEGDAKAKRPKRVSSSRRLIARRLASGRLARTKAKVPPALTASGDENGSLPDKKKLEDRARVRAKLDGEKRKKKPAEAEAEAEKKEDEKEPAAAGSEPAPSEATAEKPKKKKKKKKKKKAKKDKAVEAAKASEAPETSSAPKSEPEVAKPEVAEKGAESEAKKSEDEPAPAAEEDDKKTKKKAAPAAKDESSAPADSKLDELEEIPEDAAVEKGDKKKGREKVAEKAAEKTDEVGTRSGAKLKTASRNRIPGKRVGSKTAVDAAQADPGELPKKPGLPIVPLVAIGVFVLGLVGVFALWPQKRDTDSKVAKVDSGKLVDDLRDIANTQHPEPDELVARWQGLGDAIDGDAKNDCATEAGKAREHFEQEARSKLDDAKAKIDRALSGQSGDFDAALKALSDFPVNLRASAAWIKDGAPRQDELLRRRDAFVAGTALLKEAKRVWDSDHDAEAIQGIYAAFPDDYRTTEEGKSIADEFSKLLSDAAHVAIGAASDKARAEREKKDAENFEKSCAKRARVVAESEGNFRMELDDKPGAALFDWQVRPDMVDREKLPNDAIRCVGGHLVLKNEESTPLYLAKNKRDWSHFVVEFKIKVAKGTKAYFLGKVHGGENHGGYTWDELPISRAACKAAADNNRPHMFTGVEDDTPTTIQFRLVGKDWDVIVNGKDVFRLPPECCRLAKNPVGGFGFKCDRGSIEIESVKAKVFGRLNASGEEED